jgi:glycosyltransferase involved in cell wall biosynthesis
MQALTADQAWGGSVRWLGLRRDLPALLDASDAFVLGSAWEGMPLAAGEAMAMEKPVVATDAGGTGELLGEAGVVVPPRNASALAAGLRVSESAQDSAWSPKPPSGRRSTSRC